MDIPSGLFHHTQHNTGTPLLRLETIAAIRQNKRFPYRLGNDLKYNALLLEIAVGFR